MKDRIRISITVRPEIVNLLDTKVDGIKIRNRSHAVEQFLSQVLISPVGQAVILVGDEEKTLTKLHGETAIEKMLAKLKKASVKKIIICCKEESHMLKKFLSKKQFSEFNFIYTKNEHKGTAASLYECKKHLDPGTFLLIYGDVIADIDFVDFLDFHKNHHGVATMVITSIADPLPWGIVRVKRDLVTDFFEKPKPGSSNEQRLTNLINAGIYAFEPQIFSYINEKTKTLEDEVFPKMIKAKEFHAYLLDGIWFNISRQNLLERALKYE
jgi:NDP-sugar pyrophosphorylase family protein